MTVISSEEVNIPKDLLATLKLLLGDRCSVDYATREYHGKDFR
jgi:hypothetical protein